VSDFKNRRSNRLLRYYVADNDSLEIKYSTIKMTMPSFTVMEFSFDLMTHPQFSVNTRPAHMMPMPFVNTDAVVTKRTFDLELLSVQKRDSLSSTILNE
jgi:hypothetical protein